MGALRGLPGSPGVAEGPVFRVLCVEDFPLFSGVNVLRPPFLPARSQGLSRGEVALCNKCSRHCTPRTLGTVRGVEA